MAYISTNPATGERIESYPEHTDAQLEDALHLAQRAFQSWRQTPFSQRSAVLLKAAEELENNAASHARVMALEMGKPISQGIAEAKKCGQALRYYAEKAEAMLRPVPLESDARDEACLRFDPLGPIFAIMPWNFPYWQVVRHAAPGLMAGNVILLKHTPHTPKCALELERIFLEAGAHRGCLQALFLTNDQAAAAISDSRVAGATLTGSTGAGRKVGAIAGQYLKKMVLELGGSDPFIVFEDADLEAAVQTGVTSRCLNSGQSCIAAKRFLIQRSVLDQFTSKFTAAMAAKKVGDPLQEDTEIGPMARGDLRDQLAGQVERSRAMGATILVGGSKPSGPGFFYPPTVIADAPNDSPAVCEELFGPAATIIPFDTEQEALRIANHTEYGLGAAVFTADKERARRMVAGIEAGAVFVNGMVKSAPAMPFGGIKNSGFGRELGREGLLEFVNQKTVWMG